MMFSPAPPLAGDARSRVPDMSGIGRVRGVLSRRREEDGGSGSTVRFGRPLAGETVLCGLFPARAAGVLVGIASLAEGVWVCSTVLRGEQSWLWKGLGLGGQDPFSRWMLHAVTAWSAGDLVGGVIALVGFAISNGLIVPPNFTTRRQSLVSSTIGNLLVWRVAVALAVLPWIGYTIFVLPTEYCRWLRILVGCLYIAFSMCLVQLLAAGQRSAEKASKAMDEEAILGIAEERERFLSRGLAYHGFPVEAHLVMGCLPADTTIALYCGGSLFCSLWLLLRVMASGRSCGGYVLFAVAPVAQGMLLWLELLGLVLSALVCGAAAGGVVAHLRLEGRRVRLQEDVARQHSSREHCARLMRLLFLAVSFRVAVWFVLTGLSVGAQDFCGFRSWVSSAVSLRSGSAFSVIGVCKVKDFSQLVSAAVLLGLDCYFLKVIHQLWQRYRVESIASKARALDTPLFGRP